MPPPQRSKQPASALSSRSPSPEPRDFRHRRQEVIPSPLMPREAPILTGPALEAVRHRGSHMQIIASAGSGKTEVVSQRVVDLLAADIPPEAIVAFTFTERAAAELKDRIVD